MKHAFNGKDVSSFDTLYQSLMIAGVHDAIITIDSTVTVETSINSREQVEVAVNNATVGTLFSNKAARIAELSIKSGKLMECGVETWVAGSFAETSLQMATEHYTVAEYYAAQPSLLTSSNPYMVTTTDGRAVSTDDCSKIKKLANDMQARLSCVFSNTIDGEVGLITKITQATTQGELDSIVDGRF